jgi:hypothetical protein
VVAPGGRCFWCSEVDPSRPFWSHRANAWNIFRDVNTESTVCDPSIASSIPYTIVPVWLVCIPNATYILWSQTFCGVLELTSRDMRLQLRSLTHLIEASSVMNSEFVKARILKPFGYWFIADISTWHLGSSFIMGTMVAAQNN